MFGLGMEILLATLTRARLTIDIAHCLHYRAQNTAQLEAGGCVRYILVDSSPQFHRDYEMVLTKSIQCDQLVSLWKLSTTMLHRWLDPSTLAEDLLDEDRRNSERAELDHLNKHIVWHALPAVQIGFGASSLAHRLHAVMHSLRLELSSHSELVAVWGEVLCICSDYGTEYGLSSLEPVRDLFPYWQDDGPSAPAAEEDMLDAPGRPDLRFEHILPNDGLLHTIDNCTKDFATAMPGFRTFVRKLKAVCKIVRTKSSQDKLVERCFQDRVGRHFIADIRKFQGSVHEGRWGSVAFCLPQVRKLQTALRHGWDLQKFSGSAASFSILCLYLDVPAFFHFLDCECWSVSEVGIGRIGRC